MSCFLPCCPVFTIFCAADSGTPDRPPRRAVDLLRTVTATVLFSGLSPFAPGTAGTAVTVVAYLALCDSLTTGAWIVLLVVVTAVAVLTAGAEAQARNQEDPGPVVIDEAAGYLFTVAFLPHGPVTAIAGFLVFRALDILKPPPARQLERLPGGWGIVFDDVAAGIFSHLLLRAGWALAAG